MLVLVDDDRGDFRRLHRVDDELRRIVLEGNDVDAFTGDFVGDRLDTAATHADAGTHGIDARVETAHRDLGTGTRVTGGTEDLDLALADFRNLELEKFNQFSVKLKTSDTIKILSDHDHLYIEDNDVSTYYKF